MKQLVTIATIAIGSITLVSCGASKKMTAENARLNSVVTDQAAKITAGESAISQLKTENMAYGKEAEDCRKLKATIQEKFDNINRNLAEKGTSMKKIEQKFEDAVSKFEDAGATVTYKNGLVHVNYTNDFFFQKNSTAIGVKGREALNTVAEVMRENPGVTVYIVGHTDTLTIKGKADNWSLSTERANEVVRVLYHTYNINPARLTAAGKSKFSPVADNATEEGRSKNRRIEIIINPDLSRLWDMME